MSFAMVQIFLLVFFIVLAIGVVWKIRLLRGKRVIWVLGGYVIILLISVGLLFLPIAGEQDTAGDGLSSETVVWDIDQLEEAAYYQVSSTAEGQEVKNQHTPTLNVEEDALTFSEPESVDMEATVFEEPFPFYQFEDVNRFDTQIGGTLLYLRIPEGLELNTTERVTYVNG